MARRSVLAAAGLLTTGLLGSGAYALAGPEVPRGTTVAGVPVGGSAAQARAALAALPLPSSVVLLAQGERLALDPAAAGLRVDVEATLDEARGGPLDRLRGLVGVDRAVAPVSTATALPAELRRLAPAVDRPPREGAVRYAGLTPVPVLPEAGRTLQVEQAARLVQRDWLLGEPVEVPVAVAPVRTAAGAVEAAVAGPAAAAVAAPVALDAGGRPLVVEPADLAPALTFAPDDTGALAPVLDGAALLAALGPRAAAVQSPPVDARFDLSSGAPVVVPSAEGRTLQAEGLAAAVRPVLLAPAPRTASVALAVTPPALTTERAAALGVTEVIGTFTSKHPCCRGRVTNIHRMADIVEGDLVLPGETYSLNERVGVRDRARGFVPAPMILEGQFVDAVGGGVSQFATTMYNATFFAGLEDVEHKPHSYYISRYPEGREATISSPAPDLKWRNDSPHAVLVDTSYTGTSITVTLWGTKRYDEVLAVSSGRSRIRSFGTEYVTRSDCTATSGMVGFDITITRVMKKGGVEVARDSDSHRYTPEPRFICGPPPTPAPAPAAPPPPPPVAVAAG